MSRLSTNLENEIADLTDRIDRTQAAHDMQIQGYRDRRTALQQLLNQLTPAIERFLAQLDALRGTD